MFSSDRNLVEVDVGLLILLGKVVLKVDNPISSIPRVSTLGALEDFLFGDFSNSNIVVLEPLLKISIIAEAYVVTRVSTSLMDANAMEMIGILLQLWNTKGSGDLLLVLLNLLFHGLNLLFELFSTLKHK